MVMGGNSELTSANLLDYLEGRREGLEAADRQPRAPGDELQELALLFRPEVVDHVRLRWNYCTVCTVIFMTYYWDILQIS